MTPEQRTVFFDGIVSRLQAEGTLRHFDSPKGEPSPQAPGIYHGYEGQIRYIGDEPYSMLSTTALQRKLYHLNAADLGLKSTSIRTAIARYIPDDAFATYLDSFTQTAEEDHAYASIRRSLYEVMPEQLLREPMRHSTERISALIHHGRGEHLLSSATKGEYMDRLSRYPELVTALSIYHAAHREYLQHLTEAVERSQTLSKEEQQVAFSVLHTLSFQQFDSFLLFASVLPLAIHFYEQDEKTEPAPRAPHAPTTQIMPGARSETRWENPVDHTRMKNAIGKAWDTVFERDMMVRHYNAEGKLPESDEPAERRMVCPARKHLKAARSGQLIERIYDHVLAHPELEPLESAKHAIEKIDLLNRINRDRLLG